MILLTRKRRDFPDVDVEITLPLEQRHESRVPHGHTYSEWKFKQAWYNYRCAYCGIRKEDTPEGYLTRDHLVPITEGGDDNIDNIVPACATCNKQKGPTEPGLLIGQPRPRQRRSPK